MKTFLLNLILLEHYLRLALLNNYSTSSSFHRTELRSDMFESLMRREIAFFDDENHAVGTLTTQLADDARTVHQATGAYVTPHHTYTPHPTQWHLDIAVYFV